MGLVSEKLRRGFELGPWLVEPDRGKISRGDKQAHLEPMVMEVLVTLVANQGEVVTRDQLVDTVWNGRATTDEAIATKIRNLRLNLGDDSRNPVYIETLPKRGYRLRDSVTVAPLSKPATGRVRRVSRLLVAGLLAAVVLLAGMLMWPRPGENVDAIAVIPFRNLSAEPERYQYIVDGFGEELVVALGRIPGLRIARANPLAVGGDVQKTARDMNVGAIISGSLRTDGENIRITIEMTSASGFMLWSDRIDGAAKRIFEFQEVVAQQVQSRITGTETQPLGPGSQPETAAALDTYMRGLAMLAKRDFQSLQLADKLFAETVSEDPAFGPAYLRRAIALLLLADYAPDRKQDIYDEALAIARRGAQRDTNIVEAMQLIHAFVHHQRGNLVEASVAYEEAFRSPTRYPTVYHWYSRLLGDLGFLEESLEQAGIARSMEPASQILNSRLAIASLWMNDMENAERYFEIANEIGVGVPDHQLGMAMFYMRRGEIDAAREAVRLAFRMAQRPTEWVDDVFDSLKDPSNAELRAAAIDTLDTATRDGEIPPYVVLVSWVLFGEIDRAMDVALAEAADHGAIYEMEIVFVEEFAEFRRHPDFPKLMDSLGITRLWQSAGCTFAAGELQCPST